MQKSRGLFSVGERLLVSLLLVGAVLCCDGFIVTVKEPRRNHVVTSASLYPLENALSIWNDILLRATSAAVPSLTTKNIVIVDTAADSATQSGSSEKEDSPEMAEDTMEEGALSSDEEGMEDASDATQRRASVLRSVALGRKHGSNNPGQRGKAAVNKQTSIGARRVGSATRARQGPGATSKLWGAVRKAARTSASGPAKKDVGDSSSTKKNGENKPFSGQLTKSLIQSTVGDFIEQSRRNIATRVNSDIRHGGSIGLLGEKEEAALTTRHPQSPLPGSIVLHPSSGGISRPSLADSMTVRVATILDDLDVANLRLSVFSDFPPEVRKQFCSRSCQVLSSRRRQGATCLVATSPRNGSILCSNPDIIVGSIEVSHHEFAGTTLGKRRPQGSILYITEVAVSPTHRRQGIATRLLEAVNELAIIQETETLYLHVDVDNEAALALYEKAGYSRVDTRDPMYLEFTTSLNLHDGATKGRNHFLLYKHITRAPTWLRPEDVAPVKRMGTFGFEISV